MIRLCKKERGRLLNVWERAPSQDVPAIIFDIMPERTTEPIVFQQDGVIIGVLPVIKLPGP